MTKEYKAREQKVYVPVRGMHVQSPPYRFPYRWHKERFLRFLRRLIRWRRA